MAIKKTKLNSFDVQAKGLGLTNSQQKLEYLKGKEIIIIGRAGGHSYGPIGTTFIVGPYAYLNGTSLGGANEDGSGNNIRLTEFALAAPLTKKEFLAKNKEIELQIEELKNKIKLNLDKIEFLKETNSEEFDDNEFKAYHTLQLVDNPNLTRIEKARLIADLLK